MHGFCRLPEKKERKEEEEEEKKKSTFTYAYINLFRSALVPVPDGQI